MPCQSSTAYNISFHPTIDEFKESGCLFIDNIVACYSKDDYLMVKEKGRNNYYTHYQGVVRFDKEKRADKFRQSFHTKIMKDIEVSDLKIALKVTPITKDVLMCVGYCLKEEEDLYKSTMTSNMSQDYLEKAHKYYIDYSVKKSFKGDKVRVNKRNIHILTRKYYELNKKRYVSHVSDKYVNAIEKIQKYDRPLMMLLLADMAMDGYWIGNVLLAKDMDVTIDFLWAYFNGRDALCEFISRRSSNDQTLLSASLDRATQA